MRKLFLVLAFIFIILGGIFVFLPLDTIALAPLVIGLVFSILAFLKSDEIQKKTVKILMIVGVLAGVAIIGKHFLTKDEVQVDEQFEKTKIDSEKEAQKTLEEDLD